MTNTTDKDEIERLRAQVETAKEVILRGVEIMDTHQIGRWVGVRTFLEQGTDAYLSPPKEQAEKAEALDYLVQNATVENYIVTTTLNISMYKKDMPPILRKMLENKPCSPTTKYSITLMFS